jgi:hypothetical protein
MMKTITLTLVLILLVTNVNAGLPGRSTHRIYGKWTWTFARNSCTEVYEFRQNNTSVVQSGQELQETRFTISDQPDANGFYRMTDEVTSSNHQTGCDGNPGGTPVGDKATIYVQFHPTGDLMIMCGEPNLNGCIGPLRRIS